MTDWDSHLLGQVVWLNNVVYDVLKIGKGQRKKRKVCLQNQITHDHRQGKDV
jgi:hypothetical protein